MEMRLLETETQDLEPLVGVRDEGATGNSR